jgi:hypothetical protein
MLIDTIFAKYSSYSYLDPPPPGTISGYIDDVFCGLPRLLSIEELKLAKTATSTKPFNSQSDPGCAGYTKRALSATNPLSMNHQCREVEAFSCIVKI